MPDNSLTPFQLAQLAAPIFAARHAKSVDDTDVRKPTATDFISDAIEQALALHKRAGEKLQMEQTSARR
jgi:hypothetical protein